ncbi:MAG TPA: hypothetical protein VJ438_04365 [Candidatus Nanoarchaeia archaeon]|nr:hypothetical protein [Candidatus Nanoarchaeia archaeon]
MKTLTALLLGIGLPILTGNCSPDAKPEARLERRLTAETPGLSKQELVIIKEAIDKVNVRYQAQKIIFKENREIIGAGKSPGLCRDNKEFLSEDFNYNQFGNNYLILLQDYKRHEQDFEKESGKSINQRWCVPSKYPMLGTVIHEIGHIYYSLLTQEEKEKIAKVFWEVDKSLGKISGKKPVRGHASFYSYFYWISPEAKLSDAVDFSNEQFAETFNYLVLEHDYMGNDEGFMKKLGAVKEAMKRFEKK